MPTALFKPDFAQMSKMKQERIKRKIEARLGRKVSLKKVEAIFLACTWEYRLDCQIRRDKAAKKKKEVNK